MDKLESQSLTFQKMIFIYNALLEGWSVKMVGKDKFEFEKNKEHIKKEVDLKDYLKKFIMYNINIDNIMKSD